MGDFRERMLWALRVTGEVMAETLWPTRCAVCDMLGSVLCDACASALPYIDWWRACPTCGSPFGLVQCDTCTEVVLARLGREAWPYAACASAVTFEAGGARLTRVYKDQGEQRLSSAMAAAMARQLPRTWQYDAVTFVPASLGSYRARGFDQAELLSRELASLLDAPCVPTLARPKTRDQRTLSAVQRVANLEGRFSAMRPVELRRLLLVDDVLTTGSTLCAATDALLEAGCEEVRCLTFARGRS